ncbi:hypothetical protein SHELI_v1c08820 [Spiroplasma helicoides]|uniref:Uncharacterized protein n=1 Tax=Spiroplasma helicoides TaxID=216938 RepID=A0A1B3SLL9_9MOLU|nr:hypothetical protein [Spiroplasma helicoides]AOG60831.1 hypothetical protein SHELI_v1c08820 [Spiroplasma helicoides]
MKKSVNKKRILFSILLSLVVIYFLNVVFEININVANILNIIEHLNNIVLISFVVLYSSFVFWKFSKLVKTLNKYKTSSFNNFKVSTLIYENLSLLKSYLLISSPILLIKLSDFFVIYNIDRNFDLFVSICLLVTIILLLNLTTFSIIIATLFLCKIHKIILVNSSFEIEYLNILLDQFYIDEQRKYEFKLTWFESILMSVFFTFKLETSQKVFKILNDINRDNKKATCPPLFLV